MCFLLRFRLFASVIAVCVLSATSVRAVLRDGGIDPSNLGKGDWIYYVSECKDQMGGNIPSVTNLSSFMSFEKSHGIRYLVVKAGTGSTNFPSSSSPQFTKSLVDAAHAAGLLIFGYTRSYGSDIPGEVTLAGNCFKAGADGFVFDAEVEWETRTSNPWITNGPAQAWLMCGTVRSNWPNKFLAYASAGIISYHSTFPNKEFGYWCDAAMPMVYHYGWEQVNASPSGGINWADANWGNWQNSLSGKWTNSIKPVAPVNHVYGPNPPNSGVSHIPDEDITEFIDYLTADPHCVTAGGYRGVSFWRGDLHGAAQWANIAAATIGNFTGIVNHIVIDDARAVRVGSWTSIKTYSNGDFYGTTETNTFGTNYVRKAKGDGTAYIAFRPAIVKAGDYDVFEFHPTLALASTNVPHLITHAFGSSVVPVNQKLKPGVWNKLGCFHFDVGTAGEIRILDNIPETGSVAIADGIKLVYAPPKAVPTSANSLKATPISSSQVELSWRDRSTNETGFVIARSLSSGGPFADVGAVGPNATNYTSTNLLASTAYYFVVRATNALGSTNSTQISATTLAGKPAQFESIRLNAGKLTFGITGDLGTTNWLDYSTNLVNWMALTNFPQTSAFQLQVPLTNTRSFYRLRH